MATDENTGAARFSAARNTESEEPAICPHCHSTDTERFALFGSQLSTAQYYCRSCHTPFEYIKHEGVPGGD